MIGPGAALLVAAAELLTNDEDVIESDATDDEVAGDETIMGVDEMDDTEPLKLAKGELAAKLDALDEPTWLAMLEGPTLIDTETPILAADVLTEDGAELELELATRWELEDFRELDNGMELGVAKEFEALMVLDIFLGPLELDDDDVPPNPMFIL